MQLWHQYEQICYGFVWVGAVFYSIYSFAEASNSYFAHYDDKYNDFSNHSSLWNRKKDVADIEWEAFLILLKAVWLWIAFSVIVSEFLQTLKFRKLFQIFNIIIPVVFIVHFLGVIPLSIFLGQLFLFQIISLPKSKIIVWVANLIFLFVLSELKGYITDEDFSEYLKLTSKKSFMITLVVFWANIRCLSFVLDKISAESDLDSYSFFNLLAYVLYLPSLFTGPFIGFSKFKSYFALKEGRNFSIRIRQFVLDLTRILFWLCFTQVCLHFVYVNAIFFHFEFLKNMSSWALYGYGYTMGQFFHLKYIVFYGFSTSVAKFQNIETPSLPKCIGRIHLYSDMWKYFDNGLYKFLLRYIYIPIQKTNLKNSRFLASTMSFTFIYIWHGLESHIFIWTMLNFLGILLEDFGKFLNIKIFEKSTHQNNIRRLACLAGASLLGMSAISNFFFFTNYTIGIIFIQNVLQDTFMANMVLFFVLYCGAQVSTQIKAYTSSEIKLKAL